MRKFLDFAASVYVGLGSAALLFQALAQALTGGMRVNSGPGPVEPLTAATIVVWLACALYLALREQGRVWR